ncbi:MAG: glycosyltransferase family 2 protein [Christensenella sp.]|nr:glycosyltransferase family 2 protein [Christensenella sp.]
MKYDVTVSIVNYRDYQCAREAVKSLLAYTHGVRIKIYLIDNASGDGSAQKLADEFSALSVVFSDRNLGFGAGHNLILDRLDSEFHAVINPDITLHSDILTELTEFMRAIPDIGVCTPAIRYANGDPQDLPKRNPKLKYLIANRAPGRRWESLRRHYRMLDEDLSEATDIEFASGCFLFIRTALLKEIGGFDPRYFMYFEDADLTRTARQFMRAVFFPFDYVIHDYKRASAHKARFLMIHIASMFKYFWKWRGKASRP